MVNLTLIIRPSMKLIQQTTDGGYIISGHTELNDTNSAFIMKPFLIKLDENGDTIWTQFYNCPGEHHSPYFLKQTKDNGYILLGESSVSTYKKMTYLNDWIIKTDYLGRQIWKKELDFITINNENIFAMTEDEGFIFTGYVSSNTNSCEIWLLKTDENCNQQWMKIINSEYYIYPSSICQTCNGGYIIAGLILKNDRVIPCVIKTDENGNVIWSKQYFSNRMIPNPLI